MRPTLLAALLALLLAPLAAAQDAPPRKVVPAVVGKPAPDFTVGSLDGKTKHTLSKLAADRPVLLVFGSYT